MENLRTRNGLVEVHVDKRFRIVLKWILDKHGVRR
jgi:hypothetical protein